MEKHRHDSGIGRETRVAGQNLQHFMSHAPWSTEAVYRQVQEEVKATPELTRGGVLLVDERAEDKASDASAGAANNITAGAAKSRRAKWGVVKLCEPRRRVGFWTWLTGKLFLPEAWFEASYEKRRQRLGVPESLRFKTKVELAWDGIAEVIAGGLPFEIVGFDSLYGRSGWLRAQVRQAKRRYLAEVPAKPEVYLAKPRWACRLARVSGAGSRRGYRCSGRSAAR